MRKWIVENSKDGSFIEWFVTYEEALKYQDELIGVGIDSYIREFRDETPEEPNGDKEDLLYKLIKLGQLKSITSEDLKHLDNIVNGIVKFREDYKDSLRQSPAFLMILLLMLITGPIKNKQMWGAEPTENTKEDEAD